MKLIKMTLRTLFHFRLYTVINVVGLALSLACAILLIRYIHQETTVDEFEGKDRIFIVINEYASNRPALGSIHTWNNHKIFEDEHGQSVIEEYTDYFFNPNDYVLMNDVKYSTRTIVTDSMFLDILPFTITAGSGKLLAPNDVILTKKFAQRIFGNQDPLGKTFVSSLGKPLTVSGIVDTSKPRSCCDFDMLMSRRFQTTWYWITCNIVRVVPDCDYKRINEKEKIIDYSSFNPSYAPFRTQLFPLKKMYFDETISRNTLFQHGNLSSVIVLSVVTLLLLVVGIFNFINIYTVITLKRAREFGIKKVFGAGRKKIFLQLWVENLTMILMALCIAGFFMEIIAGILYARLQLPELSANIGFDACLFLVLLLMLPLAVTLYPFLRYSYSTPITSLRSVSIGGHSIVSRIFFLLTQYIITFCMIVLSLFFVKQLEGMLHANLGFRTDNILQCEFFTRNLMNSDSDVMMAEYSKTEKQAKVLVDKLNSSPLVEQWCFGNGIFELTPFIEWKRMDTQEEYHSAMHAGFSNTYMNMFNIPLIEGRQWNDTLDYEGSNVIINEAAKKVYGITDISKDRLITRSQPNKVYKIIGVIGNIKNKHLSTKPEPLICKYEYPVVFNQMFDKLFVFVRPDKKQEVAAYLQQLHQEIVGEGDFEYTFLEDNLKTIYQNDQRTASIYTLFSVIAILISCLGLYGLSLFDIQQRHREIALRKVNGASLRDLLRLLLRKYTGILVGSFIVSIPLSYYAIQYYLRDFAYKEPISWWLFAIAALLTTFISYATLIGQTWKAASINPASIMKTE